MLLLAVGMGSLMATGVAATDAASLKTTFISNSTSDKEKAFLNGTRAGVLKSKGYFELTPELRKAFWNRPDAAIENISGITNFTTFFTMAIDADNRAQEQEANAAELRARTAAEGNARAARRAAEQTAREQAAAQATRERIEREAAAQAAREEDARAAAAAAVSAPAITPTPQRAVAGGTLEAQIANAQQAFDTLVANTQEVMGAVTAKKRLISSAIAEIDARIKASIQAKTGEATTAQAQLTDLTQKIAELEAAKTALQTAVADQKAALTGLELGDVTTKLAEVSRLIESLNMTKEDLVTRIQNTATEIQGQVAALAA